jgi:outer membrane protein assembly factor BamB
MNISYLAECLGRDSYPLETDDWPMFHHDMAHTGNTPSTAPKTNQTLWKFNTGGPVDSPTVSDGVVYFGSLDDNIYALDAATGSQIWSFTTGANVLSPAAVAEGMVYVGSEDFNVYALNASNGAYVWSFKTGYFVDSTIAYSDGIVFVGSEDHSVYALNASTGAYIWSYKTGDQIMLSSPIVAYGIVYIGSLDA